MGDVAWRRDGGETPCDVGPPASGEVYLEYTVLGSQIKVAAVDAASGTEVTASGPVLTPRNDLGGIAARKLERRLALQGGIRV